jgi:hypothetical protein
MSNKKATLWLVALVVFVAALIAALANTVDASAPEEKYEDRIERAIVWLRAGARMPVERSRARLLSRLFRKYGKMWGVDPWIAVSIAFQESRFSDRPRPVHVTRCRTKIADGMAVEVCRKVWPGERGLMQVIPRWARTSFMACKGRSWKDPDELEDTETNVCVGMHLMAKRRARIRTTMRHRRLFVVRGASWRYQYAWKPCSPRQRRFCRNGNSALCRRLWWVASWNWGSHRLFCGRVRSRFDPQGYPIKVLRRYKMLVRKFGRKT